MEHHRTRFPVEECHQLPASGPQESHPLGKPVDRTRRLVMSGKCPRDDSATLCAAVEHDTGVIVGEGGEPGIERGTQIFRLRFLDR